mmetsp:Transcript_67980/g.208313  ORF Transcript_67980/g.208313 Transcript_67980/m.208313 type:complete len:208 (-) Transcript_67980:55-678(-)
MVVDAHRRGRAGHLGGQFSHAVGRRDQALGLLEHVTDHVGLFVGLEAGVLEDEFGKAILHKVAHIVALPPVAVEDGVQRVGLRREDGPRILVFVPRALAARVPEPERGRVERIARGLHRPLPRGGPGLAANAARPAAADHIDDALLVEAIDHGTVVLVHFAGNHARSCLAIDAADQEPASVAPDLDMLAATLTHGAQPMAHGAEGER